MAGRDAVFLVGPRACGKTSLGRRLAQSLGFAFVDTDRRLLDRSGLTVAEIVAREGWEGFRRRERETLLEVTGPEAVIATGGGVVLDPGNRAHMRRQGRVLYLSAPVRVLARRLSADPPDGQRPSLTGKPPAEEIAQVLREREPMYREAAHHVIDAGAGPDAVLAEALAVLGRGRG